MASSSVLENNKDKPEKFSFAIQLYSLATCLAAQGIKRAEPMFLSEKSLQTAIRQREP